MTEQLDQQQNKDRLFRKACGHMNRGNIERAIRLFKRTLEIDPGCVPAQNNLGNCLRIYGDIDAARALFESLTAKHPWYALGYYNLSLVSDMGTRQDLISRMEAMLRAHEIDDTDAVYLGYALGKAYLDRNEPDTAFDHFAPANDRYHGLFSLKHDSEKTTRMCDRTIEVFDADLVRRSHTGPPSPRRPIFVIGMPRSGSTLVEQILSCHTDVFGCGEVSYMKHVLYDTKMLTRSEEYIPSDIGNLLTDEARRSMAQKYWELVQGKAGEEPTVVDKYLLNFWYLGFIHLVFPDAKMIHCIRDPVANLYSCYTTLFFESQRYTYHLNDLISYFRDYSRLMRHWREVLPADVLIDVELERLVEDPDQTIRSLVADCGLVWQAQCLEPHKNNRIVNTASAVQVKKPIYKPSRDTGDKFRAALAAAVAALGGDWLVGGISSMTH